MTPVDQGQHPRAWYALLLLMLVALFAYVDRVIVAVLQEGIRADLKLSDTQLGTLTGTGFAIFYTFFALPVARLADVWVRKHVIAIALLIWSLMTAGSGLAASFAVLLLLRIGVAIGEAGGAPTSHAMISDFFTRNRRATALSIWGIMMSVGPMVGFLLGGRLQDMVGWQNTFIILGVAGMLLVPLIVLTLPEPRRGASDGVAEHGGQAPSLASVLRTIWNLKSFLFLCAGTALHALSYLAILNWSAPFYQRSHGLSATETGDYMGLAIGIGGVAGTLLGGVIADRLGKANIRWYMIVPALATILTIPLAFVQFLAADLRVSLLAAGLVLAVTHMYIGPVNATQQSLVPPGMRAMTSATLVFVTNIVGMGLGPLIAGMISDTLRTGGAGADSLRYAVLATLAANVLAAAFYSCSAWLLPRDAEKNRAAAPAD
ncbi:MAG: spinster family MFS transporter [Sphingomonadales bacterium]